MMSDHKEFGVDWQHVGMLLHIIDKSKDHPKLAPLTNAALAELDQHAVEAKKALDLAAKERADKEAEGARKHVEEVRESEGKRLDEEEKAIMARPMSKTPAEIAADVNAAKAVNEQAQANAKLEQNVQGPLLQSEPTVYERPTVQPEPRILRRNLNEEPINE